MLESWKTAENECCTVFNACMHTYFYQIGLVLLLLRLSVHCEFQALQCIFNQTLVVI